MLFKTPAPVKTVTRILAKAGALSEILGHLVSHDLRRESARDVAHGKDRPTGYGIIELALSLGHSRQALYRGVTDKYVGPFDYYHWSQRVENPPDAPKFGLEIATAPYQQPKYTATQITKVCNQKGLDASNRNERRQAIRVFLREHFTEWLESGPGMEQTIPTSGKLYYSFLAPRRRLTALLSC